MAKGRSREEQERDELGGYSAAEFDAEFARTQRSDWTSVVIRAVTLAVVYTVLARAVAAHALTSAYLWLPMAVEYLMILWLGQIMKRFVVECPRFRRSAGSMTLTLFWTLGILAAFALAFSWDDEASRPSRMLLVQRLPEIGATLRDSGLLWAFAAGALSLLASTWMEVRRWRKVGGVFVWTSVIGLGMRFGALILLGFLLFVVLVFVNDGLDGGLTSTSQRLAWVNYGFLLLVEIAALALGVLMHRDMLKESSGNRKAKARR